MADKKNDSLFQWNFNLEDSDSDFTDIDFSSSKNDSSDKDIEPIIFVRDETAKRKTEEKRPQNQTSSAAQSAKKTQTSGRTSSRPAVKKTPARKKKSSGPALNWKLIAVIAAAVLLIALLVVLLGRCGKKEEKAWTKVEADSPVKTLMDNYFAAKKDGNADAMRKVLVTDAVVNASVMGVESQIYKDYTDISLQQYPGIKKNEYVVCATYDTALELIDASVPTIGWFYALPDDSKNLRLMPITDKEKESNVTIYNYVTAAVGLISDTTVAEQQTRFNNALSANPDLAEYLQNIANGDYFTKPTGAAVSTENPENTTSPDDVTGNLMYVKVGDSFLKMRSTPSKENDNNVVKKLLSGYCVTVISIDDYGWARIRDDVSIHPVTGATQEVSGREAYVDVRYISPNYSETQ